VLKITHKNQSILITGDLPQKFERYLVHKYKNKLKSNILLVGHHGSNTSSSEEFLKAVDPEYIIISVGKDNPYHLPNKNALKRLQKLHIPILRTDKIGNIIFQFKKTKFILTS